MPNEIVMTAHVFDARKHNPVGWWMSEKLDGMRAKWTGQHLVSRAGNRIYPPAGWTDMLPKDIELDGELYMGRGKFQTTVSIVRRYTADAEAWKKILFAVFDSPSNPSKPWIERFNGIDFKFPAVPVPHYEVHSQEQLDEFYNSIVDNAGEGVMLRNPNAPYVMRRSWDVLKVKPELELTAEVTGYQGGEGKYEGMLGALLCSAEIDGKHVQFKVGSGLSDLDRTEKYKPALESKVRVLYTSLTDAGVPRHPRYNGKI